MVEFAVSAMAFVLLFAALVVLCDAAGQKTQALLAARYAAWHHLTARDTAQVSRAFFEGGQATVKVEGRTSHRPQEAMAVASLEKTFGLPVLLYLATHNRALRAGAEVTVEHRPAALRAFRARQRSEDQTEPFRTKTAAVVATDPWDHLRGVEVGVAMTGQWFLLPVLLPFALF